MSIITEQKTITPKLRFKGFDDNWRVKHLGELLEFKNGINASKEQYGRGIKFINVLDILNNEYITYDSIIGSVDVDENVASKYPVNYGDILFQRSSETREEVGTACVYLDRNKTAVFGGFVIRGRKVGEYDPIFLNKLLKTDMSRSAITSKSGGSTRYNVGQETLSSIALNFPTLHEQQKIAYFLSTVDRKIQQLIRKKELLEQYKKGVMQQLFSGNLRFKDENGKAFPKWEEKSLGDVCEVTTGNKDTQNKIDNGKYPFFVRSNTVERINSYSFDGEAILTSGDGVGVGKNFHYINGKFDFHQRVYALHSFAASVFGKFIFHVFVEKFYKRVIRLSAKNSVDSVRMIMITEMDILFPSLPEQKKIANFLSNIENKIESVNKQITQTQTFKKGLLQQMFV